MNKEVIKIVNKLIKKEAREEALEILSIAPKEQVDEFVKYWNLKQENVCCMVIDFTKIKLIEEGKMTMDEGDYFGYGLGDAF